VAWYITIVLQLALVKMNSVYGIFSSPTLVKPFWHSKIASMHLISFATYTAWWRWCRVIRVIYAIARTYYFKPADVNRSWVTISVWWWISNAVTNGSTLDTCAAMEQYCHRNNAFWLTVWVVWVGGLCMCINLWGKLPLLSEDESLFYWNYV